MRAVGIVHSQRRGLREHVSPAQAARMLGIAFDFGGAAHVAFHQQTGRNARQRHRRSVEERLARDDLFGRFYVRDNSLRRQFGAGAQSGECGRGGGELQHVAAIQARLIFCRIVREFILQEFAVLVCFRQFFQALPEAFASFLRELRAQRCQVHRLRNFRVEIGAHRFLFFAFSGGTSNNLSDYEFCTLSPVSRRVPADSTASRSPDRRLWIFRARIFPVRDDNPGTTPCRACWPST